jgi:tetratricopeptide (TPR) repeat protein
LLRRILNAHPEAYEEKKHGQTPEVFEKYRTLPDEAGRQNVYRNFERNLACICRHALDAGAAVVVSTVAVNLRDFPPLASLHRRELAPPQRERWNRWYQEGIAAEGEGDNLAAIECYRQALAIDDHHAELHYRLARCALAAGDIDTARRHFALARDWDALQFRTDSRLNDIIRNTAGQFQGEAVYFVDAEEELAQSARCPDGIPGSEFFHEHVHFHFDGDHEMAKSLLPTVVAVIEQKRGLSAATSAEVPTRPECARLLGFTPWDKVNTAAAMVKLTAKPPFTAQLEHAARQEKAEQAIASVMDKLDERFIRDVIQKYREAIAAHPEDWHLHYNLAMFLHQLGRAPEAVREFEYVVQTLPHVTSYRTLLAYALGRAGLWEQATYHFHQVLKRDPRYRPAREGLQRARQATGRP